MEVSTSFQDRVNSVFGALQSTSQQGDTWALDNNNVYRAGKDNAYSSEEDEEAALTDSRREVDLPSDLLDFNDTNEHGQTELPSNAFCRALDFEEEYDANDDFASGLFDGRKEKRPPPQTEVLDNNVFEKGSRAQALMQVQATSVPVAVDKIPEQSVDIANESERKDASGAIEGSEQGRPKRVRFSDPPSEARQTEDREAQKPNFQRLPPRHTRKGHSYVPDHVKHPEKYTVYTLDEPITVGSGNSGSADSDNASNRKIAVAIQAQVSATPHAMDIDDDDSNTPLPAFGTSIVFKRSSKSQPKKADSEKHSAAARINSSSAIGHIEEVEDTNQQGNPVASSDSHIANEAFQPRRRRERNLRSRD